MELTYRIGTTEDIKQLLSLGLHSYGQFKNALTKENWNTMHSFLIAESSYTELLSKSSCFVCETNNTLIGMAFLIPKGNPNKIFDSQWSYIRMVGVHPEYGGKGIGKKLIQMCIDFAKETNETTIALHTSEIMDSARHIYESIGFKQIKALDEPLFGLKYWLYRLEI
jgi:ribosomal protein S18 acetylase RimI-like enzyme